LFKNYLKSALRFLKQNKLFAAINAIGLSIALAVSFIILLFVINELSYDHCFKNRKRIYRVLNYDLQLKKSMVGTPYILTSALKDQFPQIEKAVAVTARPLREFRLKLKDEYINVPNAIATNSEVFDIFTLHLVGGGQHKNLLDDQSSLVLSKDLAKKLFRGQNPVGKEIVGLVDNEEHIFVIKGVFDNIPENSTFRADCFLSNKWTLANINKATKMTNSYKDWTMNYWTTWVLLTKGSDAKSLENQFRAFEIKNIGGDPPFNYLLQNLSDVYTRSEKIFTNTIKGNMNNVRLLSTIALVMVLIAAINYILLSTAVSSGRAKEIGIRKAYGAGIGSIKNQLFSESILLSILVLPVALLLMWLALPYTGNLFQTKVHIISSNIMIYILAYLAVTVFIGIASGMYTSRYLSGLRVIEVLKNTLQTGKKRTILRSLLIVIQLIIFCSFVSGTLIIRSQYQYALKKDIGYFNHDIILVDLSRDFKSYSAYMNNIKSNPNIIMAGGVMEHLPMIGALVFFVPNFQNKDQKVKLESMFVDYDFLKTMGITIIEGRDFSKEFSSDVERSIILNQTAVKRLGITDPIGKMIGKKTIIGIAKDFNLHSIHSDIPPHAIEMAGPYIYQIAVHYKPGTLKNVLSMLEAEWKKAAPGKPFLYSTIEDIIKDLYSSEKNLSTIVSIITLFTLIIASFGLFGLTLFLAKSRTKEIGIKKAFGSSERLIVFSFMIENIFFASIASLLSVPITLYFIKKWLNNFAYKASINWWIFVIALFMGIFVVLLTVYFHSYKASRINPVNSLRYE
jgi:putative ABC transport system permease protein